MYDSPYDSDKDQQHLLAKLVNYMLYFIETVIVSAVELYYQSVIE